MRLDLAQSLLLQAAEPVFRRLNQDRQSAPRILQTIFDHLSEHLFDPELSVASLRRACGLRDNGISSQFKGHTGLGIRAYFSQCRFTVAAQLLRVSEMSVSLVGELVGFASLTSFSSAFQKWSGCRPMEYRRQHRGKKPVHGPQVSSKGRAPELKESALRRALLGTLEQERAWALQAHLEDQYGAAPKVPVWKGKVVPLNEDRDLVLNQGRELEEPARALALWQELQNAPLQEAGDLLRHTAFQSPCLVHLLLRRSRQAGSRNRRRGLELALLSRTTLYAGPFERLRRQNAAVAGALEARVWGRLGDASRQAGERAAARYCLDTAELVLPQAPQSRRARAELYLYRGIQLAHDGQLGEARQLLDRSHALFLRLCQPGQLSTRWIVEVLLQRALVRAVMKDPQGSYSDLQTVAGLVDAVKEPEQAMRMYDQVSLLLAASQQWAAALEQLTLARQQAARLGRPALERVLAERMRMMGEKAASVHGAV